MTRVDHTKYPDRSSCCCDACAELRETCKHPAWRGHTQFCHDSYETWAWDACVMCGQSRNATVIP